MDDLPGMASVSPVTAGDSVDWAAFRAKFPATRRGVYAGIASSSIISDAAKEAAEWVIRAKWSGEDDKGRIKGQMPVARERFAQILHASSDEIAVTKNVTEGLNIVATAIDWRSGDNVVLCADLEHPNNIYLWLALRDRGVEIRCIPARDGAIDTDAMIAAIDDCTRIVTAATVTFTPGFRTELERIGRACRAKDALFLVDAVQSCGILDIDVSAAHVDALATSTSKGLLGVTGLGFLYVRDAWIARLRPAYIGRFSVARGDGHYSEFEGDAFTLAPDARRFEAGNYNWAGIAAVTASMGELLEIGIPKIEARAVGLAETLAAELASLGYPVTTPPRSERRSHIVTIGALGSGDTETTNDARLDRLANALREGGVKFTIRRGLVRFGFHAFNDESDVAHIVAIARGVN